MWWNRQKHDIKQPVDYNIAPGVRPFGDADVKTKTTEGEYEEFFLVVDSVKKKFLLKRLVQDAKKYGLDDPRGKKAVDRIIQGCFMFDKGEGDIGAAKETLKDSITKNNPIYVVNFIDRDEFVRDRRTIDRELASENPNIRQVTGIINKIYRGEPEPSPILETSRPSRIIDVDTGLEIKATRVEDIIDILEAGGKLKAVGPGEVVEVSKQPIPEVGKTLVKQARKYLNADELLYFTNYVENALKKVGLTGETPVASVGKPKPLGLDELNRLISEVKNNPMLWRSKDFKGFSREELDMVEKSIGMVDKEYRENCWFELDYIGTQSKDDLLKRLNRLHMSDIPDKVKKENILDIIDRTVEFDEGREMLSWIEAGHLFKLRNETPIADLNTGLSKLGLLEGDVINSVDLTAGKQKWTATSRLGKKWIFSYDKEEGVVWLYEGSEKERNKRARLIADVDIEGTVIDLYGEKTPDDFIKKFSAIGGLHYKDLALPKEALKKLGDIVDNIPGEQKILMLKLIGRIGEMDDKKKIEVIDSISGTIQRNASKPAVLRSTMFSTLHSNYCMMLVRAFALELDALSSDEKLTYIRNIVDRLAGKVNIDIKDVASLVISIYRTCGRVDPVSEINSTGEYLIANEFIKTTMEKKPGEEFLDNAMITALNAYFLDYKMRSFEETDDILKSAEVFSEKSAQIRGILQETQENQKFTEFSDPLSKGGIIDGLDQNDMERYRSVLGLYSVFAMDTMYYAAFAGPLLKLAGESLEAAREYAWMYSPKTEIGWDWSVSLYENLMENSGNIVGMVEDDKFRELFVERVDRLKGIRDFDKTKIKGIKDRYLRDALSIAIARSPEHLRFVTEPGVLEAMGDNLRKGENRHYLIREFLENIGEEPRFNTARVYSVLFKADEKTVNEAREFIRKGIISEKDLDTVSDDEWKALLENPRSIVNVLSGIKGKKEEYSKALEELPDEIKTDYKNLSEKAPALKDAKKVAMFSSITNGHELGVKKGLLDVLENAAESCGREAAVGLLASEALASKLGTLSIATYSAGEFVKLLGVGVQRLKEVSANDFVNEVFTDRGLQAAFTVESSIRDWAKFDGDRSRVISDVLNAPDECRPLLVGMGAVGMGEARRLDSDYIKKISGFISQNNEVVSWLGKGYPGENNLLAGAYWMSMKRQDDYIFMKNSLLEGKAGRAELLLQVYDKQPDYLEEARIALEPDMGADDGRIVILNEKLRRGESLNMAVELNNLLPVKTKQAPLEKPTTKGVTETAGATTLGVTTPVITSGLIVDGLSLPAGPLEKQQPGASLVEAALADENRIEENIMRDFPKIYRDRARNAYRKFRGTGGRLTVVDSRSLFHILGMLRERYNNPEWMVLYFEHVLSDPNPERLHVFTDTNRYSKAVGLMETSLMFLEVKGGKEYILEKASGMAKDAFKTVFLSEEEKYDYMTGKNAEGVRNAVSWAANNIPERRLFLAHMLDHPECRQLMTDKERLQRGRDIINSLREFALENRIEDSRELEAGLFSRVFLRQPRALELTTSEEASRAVSNLKGELSALKSRRHDVGEFAGQYVWMVLNRPEVLPNIEASGGVIPSFLEALAEMRDLPGYREYVIGYFNAITTDEGYTIGLTEPERLHNALKHVEAFRDYVKPVDILGYGFLLMPEDAQLSELELVKMLKENPEYVETRPEREERLKEQVKTEKARAERKPAAEHLTRFIHHVRVTKDLDTADEDPMFSKLNTQSIRRIKLSDISKLPAHHRRIVNFLSNLSSPGEDFSIKTGELLEILRGHRMLGRVYKGEEGKKRLDEDLGLLNVDGMVDYSPHKEVVGLNQDIRKWGKAELTEKVENELVGRLSKAVYKNPKDLELDKVIVLELAKSENFEARREDIVKKVQSLLEGKAATKYIRRRVSSLEDRDFICKTDPTGRRILLSPGVISEVEDLDMPDVWRREYLDVIDPLRRIRRMYSVAISDDRPSNRYFNPALKEKQVEGVYRAAAIISSRGDEKKALEISDVIERRIRLLQTLSNLNLNLNHGAKRERIIEISKMGESVVQGLLTDMVNAGVLERVALGYYRISEIYCKKGQADLMRIKYPKNHMAAGMHENIDEGKLVNDLVIHREFKPNHREEQAITLAKLISNQHTVIPHCARAKDILELRRILDEDATESQNTADLKSLMDSPDKKTPALIKQFRPAGTHGVFFKISDKYA